MMKIKKYTNLPGLLLLGAAACSDNDKPIFPKTPTYDMSGFAKGARCKLAHRNGKSRNQVLYLCQDAKRNV